MLWTSALEKGSFSPREYKIWVKKMDIFRMVEVWSPLPVVSQHWGTGRHCFFCMSTRGSLSWECYFSVPQMSPFQHGYDTGSSISAGERKSTPDFQKAGLFDVRTMWHWKIFGIWAQTKVKCLREYCIKNPFCLLSLLFAGFLNVRHFSPPDCAYTFGSDRRKISDLPAWFRSC